MYDETRMDFWRRMFDGSEAAGCAGEARLRRSGSVGESVPERSGARSSPIVA